MPDSRYSKSQLLELYKLQQDTGSMQRDDSLTGLYVQGWEPSASESAPAAGWGRRDESARDVVPGSEVCWDTDGAVVPLGLVDMTDEEKEVTTPCGSEVEGTN